MKDERARRAAGSLSRALVNTMMVRKVCASNHTLQRYARRRGVLSTKGLVSLCLFVSSGSDSLRRSWPCRAIDPRSSEWSTRTAST